MEPNLIASNFVKRQTMASQFSSFTNDDWNVIIDRTISNWMNRKQGYREGVLLVKLDDVTGFFSSTCQLQPNDILVGEYVARQPNEMPRKSVGVVGGAKIPAKRVDVVVYHRDVLVEGQENTPNGCPKCRGKIPSAILHIDDVCQMCENSGFAEWEIISVNASATDEPEPMTAGTLMANHFHAPGSGDGGTSTGMSDAEFVAALRVSYEYWRDKAKIAQVCATNQKL